ncbi:DUF4344 domain-containing metallopeptidase [Streptomyces sp. cmx-4-9]|uniref:DUF4344 domain-containing metallopeptidase n=1 Tax=Streptomyces sp. cmx-4-9 TaxID=2790941 RepID=UPI0039802584
MTVRKAGARPRPTRARRTTRAQPGTARARSRPTRAPRPTRASRTPATLPLGLLLLLFLLPAAGCAEPPPDHGFVLRYEQPAPADRDAARTLKDRRQAEAALVELNAYVDLPRRVTVTARSCAGEGTGYDPAEHRVELCYDDLPEEREPFARTGSPDPDADLDRIVRETLHHEAGHALVHALDLPAADDARAEEDAADDFARLILLRAGPDGEQTLLTAARAYDLAAEADPAPDPADEHAPPATRAEAHRCAVHAAAPDRHPDLATPSRAPCARSWTHTRDTWTHDLSPLLRRR